MKRIILLVFLIFLLLPLWSESSLSMDMQLFNTFFWGTDYNFYSLPTGVAEMTVRSTGNSDVKGELQIDFTPMNNQPGAQSLPLFDLKKASIKLRFPGLRITMGKTRVGWGDGFVFNSGDVLFGSLSPLVDLTQGEARRDTAWLTLVRWSPGGRTYLEAIYMPPTPVIDMTTGAYSLPDIVYSSQGGRLVTELGDLIVEAGYLYKGEQKVLGDIAGHRPYITLHGDLFFDLYSSASLAIPYDNPKWDSVRGSLNLSGGMFRQFQLWYDGTLSTRLEFLLFPYQKWEQSEVALNPLANETYALFLYPELNLAIGQNLNIPVMALVSPVDQSAQITTGFSWKVYQGFRFMGFAIIGIGESADVFAWDRGWENGNQQLYQVNGFSSMLGMGYTY